MTGLYDNWVGMARGAKIYGQSMDEAHSSGAGVQDQGDGRRRIHRRGTDFVENMMSKVSEERIDSARAVVDEAPKGCQGSTETAVVKVSERSRLHGNTMTWLRRKRPQH